MEQILDLYEEEPYDPKQTSSLLRPEALPALLAEVGESRLPPIPAKATASCRLPEYERRGMANVLR
jgi:hypothetical protein